MTNTTPLYQFPYLDGADGGKQIKAVSKSLALRLEAVLASEGQVPLDADLVSLLERVAALENGGAGGAVAPTARANLTALFNAPAGSTVTVPLSAMPESKGGFQLTNNALRIPRSGRYRAQASAYTWAMVGTYRVLSIFKGSVAIARHTQNGQWTIGPALIEFDAVEGDLITVRTEGDGAMAFQPVGTGDAPTLAVTYTGVS